MAEQDDVFGLTGERLVVAPGATLALLVEGATGQIASVLRYFSGGSCEILNAPIGSTLTAAVLVSRQGHGYLLGTSETVNVEGAARYYILATGVTTTFMHLRGLSGGF